MSTIPSSTDQPLGQLIILNGAPSAGKSSTAKAFLKKSDDKFSHVQMDNIFDALPPDRLGEKEYVLWSYVGSSLKRGSNVILDIVGRRHTVAMYEEYQPFLVAIKPELEVLRAREKPRKRDIRLAESDFSQLHEGISYNLEIDNSVLTIEQTTDIIIEAYALKKLVPAHPRAAQAGVAQPAHLRQSLGGHKLL